MPEEFESHVPRTLEWDEQRLAGDAPIAYSPTESIAFSFGYNHAIEVVKDERAWPGWEKGRWWRVVDPEGRLWCETSNEQEARRAVRPGDSLQHLWVLKRLVWRTVDV
jgi:hypothetical protein